MPAPPTPAAVADGHGYTRSPRIFQSFPFLTTTDDTCQSDEPPRILPIGSIPSTRVYTSTSRAVGEIVRTDRTFIITRELFIEPWDSCCTICWISEAPVACCPLGVR